MQSQWCDLSLDETMNVDMLYNGAILCKGQVVIVITTYVILELIIIQDMNLTQQLQTCHCVKTFRFSHQSTVARNAPCH